ncbi:MAG: protein-L-isoaspartate(D-aspartate) O-methyltransferase [Burkholderiales bacterium]|nr:protein-L-isoaspartate(D-aspartate) O-methyltransferase [Burkholderiales bacterium]
MNAGHTGIGMTSQRTRMRMVERLRGEGIADEVILAAMGEVPRHIFVDEALASRAYEDMALPLGFGQTISSPYTVARMLELLRGGVQLTKVLEIGTGCGYQAAVLSRLAKEVYSLERLAPLLSKARRHLRDARAHNVRVRTADGQFGWPEHAPFDGIVVAAAATHVPEQLLEQVVVGGKIIIPLTHQGKQALHVIERTAQSYVDRKVEDALFVPLLPGLG